MIEQNMNRRQFITGTVAAGAAITLPSCTQTKSAPTAVAPAAKNAISLATWSLNKTYAAGMWELLDIPRICREDFDIDGIEYVTHFFTDVRDNYLRPLKKAAQDHGVTSVLIMVDREGDMASIDKNERMQAALNHRKWVEIAAYLGCHAIRCNATTALSNPAFKVDPEKDPDAADRAAESFNALLDYARQFNIKILLEPHGGKPTTDAQWLAGLAQKINNSNFGLLPDFGNFDAATEEDTYQAVRLTMPYAQGVSVKGGWQPDGAHARYSLEKCLQIARDSGFKGWWGIESGIRRPGNYYADKNPEEIKKDEWQAVRWTRDAIKKVVIG